MRGSFQRRAFLTALRYNKGITWRSSPWKQEFGLSPGEHFKNYVKTLRHKSEIRSRSEKKEKLQKYPMCQIKITEPKRYNQNCRQKNVKTNLQTNECKGSLDNLQVYNKLLKNVGKCIYFHCKKTHYQKTVPNPNIL